MSAQFVNIEELRPQQPKISSGSASDALIKALFRNDISVKPQRRLRLPIHTLWNSRAECSFSNWVPSPNNEVSFLSCCMRLQAASHCSDLKAPPFCVSSGVASGCWCSLYHTFTSGFHHLSSTPLHGNVGGLKSSTIGNSIDTDSEEYSTPSIRIISLRDNDKTPEVVSLNRKY